MKIRQPARQLLFGVTTVATSIFLGGSLWAATYLVTTTNDDGSGSLRQAISNANANAGPDVINFTIPGPGPYVIQPITPLPTITNPVVIDATTQTGYTPSNAVIHLNGASLLGSLAYALHLSAGNSTIRGLSIGGFDNGILVDTVGTNVLQANFIGTTANGAGAQGCVWRGIVLDGVFNNTLTGNVIADNGGDGLTITNGGGNVILGNRIGVDVTGKFALGNGGMGVVIANSVGNSLGDTNVANGNVISFNLQQGIRVSGGGNNEVLNNYIGTDPTGRLPQGNGQQGVYLIASTNNWIAGNLITANSLEGIALTNNANGNLIQGNLIGCDITLTNSLDNGSDGIAVNGSFNILGDTNSAFGNVIAFNSYTGVAIITGTNNAIIGNSIYKNTSLGIDLGRNGVTLNQTPQLLTGPNHYQNFPLLTQAATSTTNTVVRGIMASLASTPYRLEFFANSTCDSNGYGEGQLPVGATNVTTGAGGSTNFVFTLPSLVKTGQYVTATATDPFNNTSEFSPCLLVTRSGLSTADLTISVNAVPNPVTVQQTLTYTFLVNNAGPSTANNATFTDSLPANFTLQSFTSTLGTITNISGTVSAKFGNLANGGSATVTIVGKPTVAAAGSLTNSASVSSTVLDPAPADNTASAITTVIPSSDIQVQVTSPGSVYAGNNLTYTVKVTNKGPSPATGVAVTSALPANMTLVSATLTQGTVTNLAGTLVGSIGALAVNGNATLTVVVVPTAAAVGTATITGSAIANEPDPTPVNSTDSASTTVIAAANLAVTLTASTNVVNQTQNITYTIVVTNNGPSTASAVTVNASYPGQLTYVSGTATQGGCTPSGSKVIGNLGSIPSGSSVTMTLVFTATSTGNFNYTASVSATEQDLVSGNDSATVATTVNASADLGLIQSVTPNPVSLGFNATFSFILSNAGPASASSVTFTDQLPVGVTLVSATSSTGTTTTNASGLVTCAINSLNVNAVATITIVANATTLGTLTNTATLASATFDQTPANNLATTFLTVTPGADLALTQTAVPNPVNVLSNLTYTLTVTNKSAYAPTNVTLTDPLPAGVSFITATPSQGSASQFGGTVSANFGTLPIGGRATLTIQVQATGAGTQTNTASVVADQPDPVTANNTATTLVPITPIADVGISMVATAPSFAGSNLTFTITAVNNGPSPATAVTVTDVVPASYSIVSYSASSGTASKGANNTVTGNLGMLGVGASATVTIVVTPTATGSIVNTATVTATETDPLMANNSASVTSAINPAVDLTLTVNANASAVYAGANITWTLKASNGGPSPASNVTFTNPLPTGIIFQPSLSSPGCTNIAGVIICNVASIAKGSSSTITIVGTTTEAAVGIVTNTATVTPAEQELAPADNTASDITTVNPQADLGLTLTQSTNSVSQTQPITYTIVVTNNGVTAATGVSVTMALPSKLTYISSTTTQGSSTTNGSSFVATLGAMPAGSSATITILFNGLSTGTFGVSASLSANENDPVNGNNSATVATTVAPAADLGLAQTVAPNPVSLSFNTTFSFVLTNAGPSTAQTVTFTNQLPAGVTLVSATSSTGTITTNAGGLVTCAINSLNANATATITIVANATALGTLTNTATLAAATFDQATANNTATSPLTVSPGADLALTQTAVPNPVTILSNLTYTITVTNKSAYAPGNVTITDPLPAGVTLLSTTPSTTLSNGVVVLNVGTLPIAGSATLTIVAQATGAGTLANAATVTATEPDPVTGNNTATTLVPITPVADVAVSMTASAPAFVSSNLTFVITAVNNGPSPATAVTVTDIVPGSYTIVAFNASQGSASKDSGNTITGSLGTLGVGSNATVTIVVTPTLTGSIPNTATVAATETDPVAGNNSATVTTTINPAVNLALTFKSDANSYYAGNNITYTLKVTNGGPSPASNVTFTDPLPAGIVFVPGLSSPGCVNNAGVITCNVGAVGTGAGGNATITIVGTATAAAVGVVTNTASVGSTELELAPADNTASVSSTVNPQADLGISVSANVGSLCAGSSLTYTIIVTNNGPMIATGAAVRLSVPNLLTIVSTNSTQGSFALAGAELNCLLGNVPVGGSVTINVGCIAKSAGTATYSPYVTATSNDPVSSNNTASVTNTVNATADLSISQFISPNPPIPGSNTTYTLTAANLGPVHFASNVIVSNPIPPGVIFVSAATTQGTITNVGNLVLCNLGQLEDNKVPSITLVLKPSTATYTNLATISGSDCDPVPGNNLTGPSVAIANLTLNLTATPSTVAVASNLTYSITVTNLGPESATNVTLTDPLPAGATFVSLATSQGTGTNIAGTVTCNFGGLTNGAGATATLVVKVNSAGTVSNTASVAATEFDPISDDNTASVGTTVKSTGGITVLGSSFLVSMDNAILRFNSVTGAVVTNYPTGLVNDGLTEAPDGSLYVLDYNNHQVVQYDITGNVLTNFGAAQLAGPERIEFGPDGNLYVTDNNSYVQKFDPSGNFLGTFITTGSGGLSNAKDIVWGADGNAYVSSYGTSQVIRYNGTSGAFLNVFATGTGGFEDITFGPDNNLYVVSYGNGVVYRYNGTTGASLGTFVSDLTTPYGLNFDPAGNLVVSERSTGRIKKFNGTTGALIGTVVSGLTNPAHIANSTTLFTTTVGGADTFTVRLQTAPTAPVTITFTSTVPGQGTLSASSLTFSNTNWNMPQTVTVTGAYGGSAITQIYQITGTAVSADGNYNNAPVAPVTVINNYRIVVDTQPPTITAPPDVTVDTDAGQCYATGVALGTATATDNVAVASITNNAPAQFPKGTNTVTWTATDTAGNTATATQKVIVRDTQLPTITAPATVTVSTDTNHNYASNVALGLPTTADNCGVASVTNNAPTQYPLGTNTVTWTVTDTSGNIATATQKVIVRDTQPPTITAPATVNVGTDAGTNYATGVTLGSPVTSDNVAVTSVTNNAPTKFPLGTNTVTWTAKDAAGNAATATQLVIVRDTQPPTLTAPPNRTVGTDAGKNYATGVALGVPTTSDNVGVVSLTNNAPVQFPFGTNAVAWTAADAAGNSATATQKVIVIDTELPRITAPNNVTVQNNPGTNIATGVALGVPTTSDNVAVAGVTSNAPAAFPLGSTLVVWKAVDTSGNSATATQTVTVVTTAPPTITAPADLVVPADTNQCSATGVALGSPTVAAAAGVASVTNNAPAQFPKGVTVVTWSVTDSNNVTAVAVQKVTVVDLQNPTITAPTNRTVSTAPGHNYATSVALGVPAAADNCGFVTIVNDAPAQFNLGVTPVHWKAADASGNTAIATQLITVVDMEPPTITAPANLTINPNPGTNYASGVALGSPVYADNVGVTTVTNNAPTQFPLGSTLVVWTASDAAGNSASATQTVNVVAPAAPTITAPANVSVGTDAGQCSATGVTLGSPTTSASAGVATIVNNAPATFPKGVTPVIWTVTDTLGRTATATQTVTVADNEIPAINAKADVTVSTDAGTNYASHVTLVVPSTSDNCGIASLTNNAPAKFPLGITTVTWTVRDTSGNPATDTQRVTVIDTEPPTITAPADVSVFTDAGTNYATNVALRRPITADNVGIASVASNAPPQFALGTNTVIWTATDAAGNYATATQNVVVVTRPLTGPDLTGSWVATKYGCFSKGVYRGRCYIVGYFEMVNAGTAPAARCRINYYRSKNPVFDTNAKLLKSKMVSARGPGQSIRQLLGYRLAPGDNPTGDYLIAVIDADNVVAETTKTNNVIVDAPLE